MSVKIGNILDVRSMLRRRPQQLGVAIEGHSVRIVRMKKPDGDVSSVAAFGELDLDLWHASIMDQQRFKSAIRQLGEGVLRVAVNVEHATLRIRRMNFAKMPERDMREAIRWNFRESVGGNIEQYLVGFTVLEGKAESGKVVIMAYGIAREALQEYLTLLRSVGLKPVSLEPQATALLTAFYVNGVLADGKYHVCISFGETFTQFIVMQGRSMLFSRPLPGITHDAMVRLVMKNVNLEEREAKEAFAVWAASSGGSAKEAGAPDVASSGRQRLIETAIGQFLSQLVVEVQRSIDAFCIMYGVDRVTDIFFSGEAASYPGLVAHVQKTLGIPTKIFNPFERTLEPTRLTTEVLQRAPAFAVALGLAIA